MNRSIISTKNYISDYSWTQWFDRDNPSGTEDNEMLVYIKKQYVGKVCSRPTAIEAILEDGR